MAWLSLKIEAKDNTADLISDALMEMGALSAIIEDANAETPDEQPIFGEPGDPPPGIWQQNVVSALFDEGVDVEATMAALEEATRLPNLAYTTETIQEQDWVRATQSQFDPIHIRNDLWPSASAAREIWIVPSWHDAPDANALNIVLDPGLAFGTGSHPTTHLCLAWLSHHISAEQTVLDYGCGSGILAIAAKKLGAGLVVGVDIDAQAIQSSHYNAEHNDCQAQFYLASEVSKTTLSQQTYDVVVANILSSALSVLAPALAKACKTGGKIALSGILSEQITQLTNIYSEWFTMNTPITMDGWVLLTGVKK